MTIRIKLVVGGQNTFGYNTISNKQRIIQRTRMIKEELIAAAWNPETTFGRWLVMNEYDDL
jgi:hypothetical protein